MSLNLASFANYGGDEENIASSSDAPEEPLPVGIRVKNEFAEPEESSALRNMGLPTSFGLETATVKKGEKQSFYCDLCFVELNSLDTMRSHLYGSKHLKKQNQYEQNLMNEGKIVDKNTYIRSVPHPKNAPKKIPVPLKDKLSEIGAHNPIVGLAHITEIISVSNVEMEPFYECNLCNNQGEANGMVNHILGRGHREKFFSQLDDRDYSKMSSGELCKQAGKRSERGEWDLIKTIYSDELYPWPSGKAPWSLENGGTGNPPTYNREFMRDREKALQPSIKPDPDNPFQAAASAAPVVSEEDSKVIFQVKALPALHTYDDLRTCYSTAKRLIEKATEYQRYELKNRQFRTDLDDLKHMAVTNIEELERIKLRNEFHAVTVTPFSNPTSVIKREREIDEWSEPRSYRHARERSPYRRDRSRSPSTSRSRYD